jgi:hypothetical protein
MALHEACGSVIMDHRSLTRWDSPGYVSPVKTVSTPV